MISQVGLAWKRGDKKWEGGGGGSEAQSWILSLEGMRVCGYMNGAGVCGRAARELWICLCLYQIQVGHQAACNLSDTDTHTNTHTHTHTHAHTPSTMCTQCPLYWPPCPCNRDDRCIIHHMMLAWKHTLVFQTCGGFDLGFQIFLESAREAKLQPFRRDWCPTRWNSSTTSRLRGSRVSRCHHPPLCASSCASAGT